VNLKNVVPSEVRLDQARHKARKAYGRQRIMITSGDSETYRVNWDAIWGDRREPESIAREVIEAPEARDLGDTTDEPQQG